MVALAGSYLRSNIDGGNAANANHQTIVQLFFLQNFGIPHITAIAGASFAPTWSVAVEEQFYWFVPLVIRFFSKRMLYVLLTAVITGAPLLRLVFFFRLPR